MNQLKAILLNNFFIAFVFSIPLILIFALSLEQYKVEVIDLEVYTDEGIVRYFDLDNDENSEKIILRNNLKGNACLKIYNPGFVGQFNTNVVLCKGKNFVVDNAIGDHKKEVFFNGMRNDSIFLIQFNYQSSLQFKEYFLDTISDPEDMIVFTEGVVDLNKDGNKEVMSSINAGYALTPRHLYGVDIQLGKIKKTPFTGAKKNYGSVRFEANNAINSVTISPASSNYGSRPVAYTDAYPWLMIYDANLQFYAEPQKVADYKSITDHLTFTRGGKTYILTTIVPRYKTSAYTTYKIYSTNGQLVHLDSIKHDQALKREYIRRLLFPGSGNHLLYHIDYLGDVFALQNDFTFKKIRSLPELDYSNYAQAGDFNQDGRVEYLLHKHLNNIYYIIDHSLKKPIKLDLTQSNVYSDVYSYRYENGKFHSLVIQKGLEVYYISYRKNRIWGIRHVLYVLIYIAVWLFIRFMMFIQQQRLKREYEQKQQIRDLQFKLISSQLNPHFTFNVLNSLSHAVYNPEKPELYDQFTSFSRLIRNTLGDTYKITRTLCDELTLTRDYLRLQKMRFKDAFSFDIKLASGVNEQVQVPKMIIQLFVENSIKHGFPNISGSDHILIQIDAYTDHLKIEVRDNGVGRKAAAQRAKQSKISSTGLGIKVMKSYLDIFNKNNTHSIELTINDLKKNGKSMGTSVVVNIPNGFKY